jgi:hypothetical protein
MSLRIRRGTEAQRTGATFDLGEIVYATDTNKLYVGDGVNLGGKNILATSAGTGLIWNATTQRLDYNGSGTGIVSVQADANPSLGGNLNLNSRNITGTGNITITGTLSVTGINSDLNLNSRNITGTGNIAIVGNISGNGISGNKITVNTAAASTFGGVSTAFVFESHRGTSLSPTTVNTGDILSTIAFSAYDASLTYSPLAAIYSGVSYNTIGTYATPGQLNFAIKDDNGTLQTHVIILSNGILSSAALQSRGVTTTVKNTFVTKATSPTILFGAITFDTTLGRLQVYDATGWKNILTSGQPIEAANYATGSYPGIPVKGMIIFDSTLNKFYGYNGTAWVAFTGP